MRRDTIHCDGVSKEYRLGEREPYRTLREAVSAWARQQVRGAAAGKRQESTWALRDVDFRAAAGEAVAVIGRNGAGKSTLLRILAGITEPTRGQAAVRGRVGSLLEVGTGFHSELTGRENVYLRGAILGLKRSEIRRKFDEIVAFAEVEPFLDTPVKRYSNGMRLRLAFAVAAQLDTEILLLDEILTVGDVAFQRKCMDTMGGLDQSGRTIVFVSHDLAAVRRLCPRAVLLDHGRVAADGPTNDVIVQYLSGAVQQIPPGEDIDLRALHRGGTGEVRATSLCYRSADPVYAGQPFTGGPLEIVLGLEVAHPLTLGCAVVTIRDRRGVSLIDVDSSLLGTLLELRPGPARVRFTVERLPLNPGVYGLGLWLARRPYDPTPLDHIDLAADFEVLPDDASKLVGYWAGHAPIACDYRVEAEQEA